MCGSGSNSTDSPLTGDHRRLQNGWNGRDLPAPPSPASAPRRSMPSTPIPAPPPSSPITRNAKKETSWPLSSDLNPPRRPRIMSLPVSFASSAIVFSSVLAFLAGSVVRTRLLAGHGPPSWSSTSPIHLVHSSLPSTTCSSGSGSAFLAKMELATTTTLSSIKRQKETCGPTSSPTRGYMTSICNSSVEDTTRQQITFYIPNLNLTDDRVHEVVERHDLWKDDLLSYHCQYLDDNVHCFGFLRGGGHLLFDQFRSKYAPVKPHVEFEFLTGCGLGGADGGVRDVNRFVREVEDTLLRDDPEYMSRSSDEELSRALVSVQLRLFEFRNVDKSEWDSKPLHADLGTLYLSSDMLMKRDVVSVQTDFQEVDILDVLDLTVTPWDGYRKSLGNYSLRSSYESAHRELYRPNRIVFLDGVMQSTSRADEAYHEALVHPGMFAHSDPRRVAIIGGGEGATLREVLKHDTVDHVKMIEIDPRMVEVCSVHLPDWNSCGDIVNSTDSCFDEPRAGIHFQDAMAWFIDRFADWTAEMEEARAKIEEEEDEDDASSNDGGDDDASSDDSDDSDNDDYDDGKENNAEEEEQFDVIIMDALDPDDHVAFADVLYNSDIFFSSLYNALTDDGILVMQLGEVPGREDPPEEYTERKNRANVLRNLHNLGFRSLHEYQEPHCGFHDAWSFLVACKSINCRRHWFSDGSVKDVEIRRRLRRTRSGAPPLKYVDGATLASYQVPHVAFETTCCRSPLAPEDCAVGRGYNPHLPLFSSTGGVHTIGFEVGNDGRVVAKAAIPQASYLEVGVGDPIYLSKQTLEQLTEFPNVEQSFFASSGKNKYAGFLSVGIVNLMKSVQNTREANVGTLSDFLSREHKCSANAHDAECHNANNIVVDRHLITYGGGAFVALRNISKGEELVVFRRF